MKNFKTYGQFLAESYSDEERKELADKGFALSDGSFPIKDLKDLKNAIQAYGRAKDQARAAKFIVKRAKALGAEDLIPDTEDFQKSLGESVVTEGISDKEAFSYLNDLRDSGVTNMLGAGPYLQRAFDLDKRKARQLLLNWMKSFQNESKLSEAKALVSKKDIKDIEDSGNIDIAYKKAMALLKSLSESVVTEAKDDYTARYKDTNINLKKGYKHLNDEELEQLYLELGELISDNKLKVKNATLQFESSVTESLSVGAMASMLLGLGIATRIGFMSDEKYASMLGSIKPTAKAMVKSLPIIGKKIKDKELKDYQTKEVEKYLNDEISDKDIVAILNENPKIKKALENLASGTGMMTTRYSEFYKLIKELGGAANKWGNAHDKFKKLRKKISDGKVLESAGFITEGTDIGSWNQGGLKGDKNVLVTTFVGPKAVEDFGLGRKCMQINVGMDYVSLNPADIVELKDLLKSYKVK